MHAAIAMEACENKSVRAAKADDALSKPIFVADKNEKYSVCNDTPKSFALRSL